MTREEYINFANCLKNNYTIDFDVLSEFCDMAISAVKWIPVSERLPEESKNYLVIIREKFNKDHWWIDICDIDTDGFAKTWNVREPYYVEAWMPLPEPYKGGEV